MMLLNCGFGEEFWESFGQQEIKPVNSKGKQSWIFVGRTNAEAAITILWPPDGKSWLIRKDPGAGKDWRREEKGTTEDEMIGWHHQLNGHEFEYAPEAGDGQGSLACCSPWGVPKNQTWLSDRTAGLNVCCDPHKGFCVVNEKEKDVFSGIPLLSLWSNGCWQFDLWFLCLF